jgi:putative DNA primase/helicase
MTPDTALLAQALTPITERVRTDITAVKRADGVQAWTHQPLTAERLAKHLNGGPARGVCPIMAGQSVTLLSVLDFDSHGGELDWLAMSAAARRVADALELGVGAAPILFRSGGGRGLHLYCLWEQPQDAYSVRTMLRQVLAACGLRSGSGGVGKGQVEIFPKQDSVQIGGSGNQFILPLAGHSAPLAWCDLSEQYRVLPRAAVLDLAWPLSDDVDLAAKPERAVVSDRSHTDVDGAGGEADVWAKSWRAALAHIPNSGTSALSYDQWRNIVFAIHHETGGSDEGLALAHEFSARSSKYVAEFLDDRVWPYVRVGGGVTGEFILHTARVAGWIDPSAFPLAKTETEAAAKAETGAVAAAVKAGAARRGLPEAQHLCTDQANAQRLVRAYGGQILVSAGLWHVWDGTRWVRDEADVYRYACRLSAIVRDEAARRRAAAASITDSATLKKALAIADALDKWSTKSEMAGTINAAIGLVRKMLTVDADQLDANPWLLNCTNGTLDLRTGELRAHDAGDLITKITGVAYVPRARSELWERTIAEIYSGDAGVISFAQRWFGYCATGSVREQVFVIHWGSGSNGKTTVIESVASVLGDYAAVAPPGLLSGVTHNERHPTEIAGLMGKRMVTASETEEGAALREAFIKSATGGDRLSARFMREDFFEFTPTHKMQILTNPKPVVRGQDEGIWRRIRLLPYVEKFGDADEVAAGRATKLKVLDLAEVLRSAQVREAVLAWVVAGARAWFGGGGGGSASSGGGLPTPSAVMLASRVYRLESDRIGEFVTQCCELGASFSCSLVEPGGGGGLYVAYCGWCREGGITHPFTKRRFLQELERVVPAFSQEAVQEAHMGVRRRVQKIYGVRILVGEDTPGTSDS